MELPEVSSSAAQADHDYASVRREAVGKPNDDGGCIIGLSDGGRSNDDQTTSSSGNEDSEPNRSLLHEQQADNAEVTELTCFWAKRAAIAAFIVIVILLLFILITLLVHHSSGSYGQTRSLEPVSVKEATASAAHAGPVSETDQAPAAPLELPADARMSSEVSRSVDWIQIAIDIAIVPTCTKGFDRMQPCKNQTAYITPDTVSDHHFLRPLRCVDDAYLENPTLNTDSCAVPSRTFKLYPAEGRLQVLKTGVYFITARVTIRLQEAAQVHFGVGVNGDHLTFLCTAQSYGAPSPDQPAPYSDCSVQGLRRLNRGDRLQLFVPQGGVPLQSLYRSTFAQVARVGD